MSYALCCHALCALLISAEAQQPTKVSQIGLPSCLSPFSTNSARARGIPAGFARAWVRRGENHCHRVAICRGLLTGGPAYAAELVHRKVDVIVTAGPLATRAAKAATATIPIVMTQDPDPVGQWVRDQPCATGREHYGIVTPYTRT